MVKVLLTNTYDQAAMGALQEVGGKQIPLGLCYIAAMLEKEGHTVAINDELVGQDALSRISKIKPDVVFLSVFPSSVERAIRLAKACKEIGAMVVVGGAVAHTNVAKYYLDRIGADVLVMGEGEFASVELLKKVKVEKGKRDIPHWHAIPGLIFYNQGKLVNTGDPKIIVDLDSLPFPAVHLLDLGLYNGPTELGFFESMGRPTVSLMTARGCQFACHFCASANRKGRPVRFRSPENIVAEIEMYVNTCGVRHFCFNDDTFTANIPRVIKLCNLIIETGLSKKICWIVQTRAEICTEEMFQKMKAAGCVQVAFGVESGSPKVLTVCNKMLDLDLVRRGVVWAKKAGLRVKTYWQIGLPGEEEADFNMSLNLVKELNPDYVWLSFFTPLPNTKFFEDMKTELKLDELDEKTYFSINRDQTLVSRHKKFLRVFYLRPAYLFRFLKRFSFDELRYYWLMSGAFVRQFLPRGKPVGN